MATSPKKPLAKKTASKKKSTKIASDRPTPKLLKPFVSFGGYIKGAWFELRQVRWPNRRATWSLTVAVLLFTAFFVVMIVLLDIFFKYIFELILG